MPDQTYTPLTPAEELDTQEEVPPPQRRYVLLSELLNTPPWNRVWPIGFVVFSLLTFLCWLGMHTERCDTTKKPNFLAWGFLFLRMLQYAFASLICFVTVFHFHLGLLFVYGCILGGVVALTDLFGFLEMLMSTSCMTSPMGIFFYSIFGLHVILYCLIPCLFRRELQEEAECTVRV